jgi:carbonic anhydrase
MASLKMSLLLLVVAVALAQGANLRNRRAAPAPWGYRDDSLLPPDWGTQYPNCYGNRQSPIDIQTANTVYKNFLTSLTIARAPSGGNTDDQVEKWLMKNNGHSSLKIYSISFLYAFNLKFFFSNFYSCFIVMGSRI